MELKTLKTLPKMVGITPKTARWLDWKSLWWMVTQDEGGKVWKRILRRPFFYAKNYFRALFLGQRFIRDGDFFLYGLDTEEAFIEEAKKEKRLVVLGFSYCHKPFECPEGRFSDRCRHDLTHPVCSQCFIGSCVHSARDKAIPLFIPTIHYIGERVLALAQQHPDHQLLFLITACELTLTMFAPWGHMAKLRGIGVRLDGRICNTMRAFALSEKGVKPGLTVVLEPTQQRIFRLLHQI